MGIVLSEQQERIILKVGKMLLNFQALERKLKNLLASRKLEGPQSELMALSQKRHSSYGKSMLGLLAGELTAEAIRTGDDEEEVGRVCPNDHFRLEMTFQLTPAELDTFSSNLKALVDGRNKLVHHYSDLFDLKNPQQWDAAEQFVDDLRERFIPLNQQIDNWILLFSAAAKAILEEIPD